MSNQIVISSGAKVRNLSGVLTATSGIVDSVGYGTPNGVATLDALGKVPLSQLPASVVTYLGTWNAATNTPTLTNGVGDVGDLYICNVAGTVNFGAGPITFAVGDWVIYSGTEWQKSAGASGTVTSVALTESGDALTITGSPITTSGTINIGFAGTGSQYIKGDGTLATFPTTIDQAKRLITEVYNSTGATLTKGTVVYINGGQGNLPTVTKAQANNDANSAQTYGVVQDDITNNNNGFVVVLGSLTDLDTSAYVVGTQLYLSGTTAGAWTSTKPSAPIHLVYVAIVVRSHPTQGVVEVRIQNGYELEEIHDVAISAPVNNQGIFYNSSNDLWENKSIATALGYTPANDALVVHLAGTETITGVKNFDVGLTLKDGIYPTPSTGYIGLASNGDGLTILTKSGATVYNHNIQFQASSNDYNFPAITGIMAMLEGSQTFTGSKTFSATTALNSVYIDGYSYLKHQATSGGGIAGYTILDAKANGVIEYIFPTLFKSVLDFNDGADYTYTFPASSGTIALTSNLSSYVPYTGATGNVNLGTNNLTASNLFGETSLNVKILGSGSIYSTGYSTFSTLAGKLTLAQEATAGNLKAFTFDFSAWSTNTSYTYTLPAINGTLALLEGSQTFTGEKVFNNNALFNSVLSVNYGAWLQKGVPSATFSSAFTTLYSEVGAINAVFRDNTNQAKLQFQSASNYTYTFPDASGTIALTSNLSAYLPLTGGTLTGGLSGTTANFSGDVTLSKITTAIGLEYQVRNTNGASGNHVFKSFNTAILTLDGGTNAATFSGALSGTTANFQTTIGSRYLQIRDAGTSTPSLRSVNDTIAQLRAFAIEANTISLRTGASSGLTTTEALAISATGAATFSSDVILSYGKSLAFNSVTNQYITADASGLYLGTANLSRLNINTSGVVTITAIGTGTVTATSGVLSAVSDMNLKIEDGYIDNALEKVMNLKPRYFLWKEESGLPTDLRQLGFYAQEVNEALGEEVANTPKDENQSWGIYDRGIIAMLTKAIQEQQAQIEELKALIAAK